jgi:hypothetical protein
MHYIKTHLWLLTTLLLVLLTGAGCSGDKPAPPSTSEDLTLALSFEKETETFDGLRTGVRYFFEESQTLDLTLTQGSKVVALKALPLKDVDANQSSARVVVPGTRLSGIDLSQPYDLTATLVGDQSRYGSVVLTPKVESIPLHLLKEMPVQMTASLSGVRGSTPSAALRRSGTLFLLRTYNASEAPLTVADLGLTVDGKRLEGNWIATELPPKRVLKTLLWLPMSEPRAVTLSYGEASTKKPIDRVANGQTIVATFTAPHIVTTDFVEALPPEEADTSNGGDPVFSEKDVKFWVGEGSHKSYFVLDFHEDDFPQALVWGYRWTSKEDEEITSVREMITDIVRADPRLYVLYFSDPKGPYGTIAGGFGYLLDSPSDKAKIMIGDHVARQVEPGIYEASGYDDIDIASFDAEKALWRSGWKGEGYWSFHNKSTRLDRWGYSSLGMTKQPISDGSWHAFSFQVGWESMTGAPPSDKFVAAEPPMED